MLHKTKKGVVLISVGIEVAIVSSISWETAVIASAVGFIVLGLYELSYFGNKGEKRENEIEQGTIAPMTPDEHFSGAVLSLMKPKNLRNRVDKAQKSLKIRTN